MRRKKRFYYRQSTKNGVCILKAKVKAKWIVGISGAAFSAFVLGQLNEGTAINSDIPKIEITKSMSEREIELAKLDWSNFSVQSDNSERTKKSDRISKRS